MNIEKPSFTLRQPCPICGQGNSLLFLTCPACEAVIVACDEEGTIFPNPKDLSSRAATDSDQLASASTTCPHCGKVGEFSFSTGEQIQAFGFTPEEYE